MLTFRHSVEQVLGQRGRQPGSHGGQAGHGAGPGLVTAGQQAGLRERWSCNDSTEHTAETCTQFNAARSRLVLSKVEAVNVANPTTTPVKANREALFSKLL